MNGLQILSVISTGKKDSILQCDALGTLVAIVAIEPIFEMDH